MYQTDSMWLATSSTNISKNKNLLKKYIYTIAKRASATTAAPTNEVKQK